MMVRNKREVIVFFFILLCFICLLGEDKMRRKAIEERGSEV